MKKRMTVAAAIAALVLLSLALPPHASANGCHQLNFEVSPPYYVDHAWCSGGVMTGSGRQYVNMMQDGGYGPKCFISIAYPGNGYDRWHSDLAVHQNLCVLKSGNIHVTPQSGATPVYTIHEGSFGHSREGEINVTGFNPASPPR